MLKKILALLAIASALNLQVAAQQPLTPEQTVLITKGTVLKFALLQEIDTATAKVGDDVPLRLSRPLIVDGATIIPEGQVFNGRLTVVKQAEGRRIQNGEIDFKSRRIDFKLDQISFKDSTTAKTRVWFSTPLPVDVPDKYSGHRHIKAVDDIATVASWAGFLALLPFFWPAVVTHGFPEFSLDRDSGDIDSQYPKGQICRWTCLPADSIVAVAITNDHRVRF